jgi:hypothetical protein
MVNNKKPNEQAEVDVNAHILIKNKSSGKVILKKRG